MNRRRFLGVLGGISAALCLGGCTVVNDRCIRLSDGELLVPGSMSGFLAAAREYSVVDEALVGPVVMSKYYPFVQDAGRPPVIVSHDSASFGGGPVINSIPAGRHFDVGVYFDIGFWRGKSLSSFAEECRRQRIWQREELNRMIREATENRGIIMATAFRFGDEISRRYESSDGSVHGGCQS